MWSPLSGNMHDHYIIASSGLILYCITLCTVGVKVRQLAEYAL